MIIKILPFLIRFLLNKECFIAKDVLHLSIVILKLLIIGQPPYVVVQEVCILVLCFRGRQVPMIRETLRRPPMSTSWTYTK